MTDDTAARGKHQRRSLWFLAFMALVGASLTGCRCGSDGKPSERLELGQSGAAIADSGSKPLPPLGRAQMYGEFPLGKQRRAVWVLPAGTTRPRPIAIFLGTAYDLRADCRLWGAALKRRAFLLCVPVASAVADVDGKPDSADPTGPPTDVDGRSLLRIALKQLKAEFGDYVASGSVLLIAPGPGAPVALRLMREEPAFFARVLFVDAELESFSATLASVFASRGGQNALFLCSSSQCAERLSPRVIFARRAGLKGELIQTTADQLRDPTRLETHIESLVSEDARFGLSTRPASSAITPSDPAPLPGPAQQALTADGYQPAVVSVPVGATQRRPLLIALHGNFDRPEWQCQSWREITDACCFVLCPRGLRRSDVDESLDRWTYPSYARTKAELLALLAALEQKFEGYVDVSHPIVAGFSLGASHAARLALEPSLEVSRAVLIEGGYTTWSAPMARRFRSQGGKALLLGCGQSVCRERARRYQQHAKTSGLAVKIADGGDAGHTYTDAVSSAIKREFPSLVAEDPRFSGLLPAQ